MRKTALLSGVAGLLMLSAPAFAQDGTAPQTPPAPPPGQTAEAPTLTLQPGMTVRGGDGELGVLVGARMNGNRQQLTVRGADGVVRAVPIDGIHQEGDVVIVDFTLEQFGAADTVTQPAIPATPAEPGVAPATPATPAVPGNQPTPETPDEGEVADDPDVDPATPAAPATPATPAVPGVSPAVPATPATPATPPAGEEEDATIPPPPTLPPENPAATPQNPAAPAPGEAADQEPDDPDS